MKAYMNYIVETKEGKWKWWTVTMGGFRTPRGPKIKEHAQITLEGEQFTLNPEFNRRNVTPRPNWAIGLALLGVLALGFAGMSIEFPVGAAMYGSLGIAAMVVGGLEWQKRLNTYALFCEGIPMQVPFIRKWADRMKLEEAIGYTTHEIAQDAGSQLGREILNPAIPWGYVIAGVVGGLGGGAILGMLAGRGGK